MNECFSLSLCKTQGLQFREGAGSPGLALCSSICPISALPLHSHSLTPLLSWSPGLSQWPSLQPALLGAAWGSRTPEPEPPPWPGRALTDLSHGATCPCLASQSSNPGTPEPKPQSSLVSSLPSPRDILDYVMVQGARVNHPSQVN